MTAMSDDAGVKDVMIDYVNWRGIRSFRTIIPGTIRFGSTAEHPEPQWLMEAVDTEKGAARTFAIKDIHSWTPFHLKDV
jgi:hypothetical protein